MNLRWLARILVRFGEWLSGEGLTIAREDRQAQEAAARRATPDDTPHYAMSPVAQGEAITEPQADMRLRDAAQDAAEWLRAFGWNRYGVAVRDDFDDHVPILVALEAALAGERWDTKEAP